MSGLYDPERDLFDTLLLACRTAMPPDDLEMRKLWLRLEPLDPGFGVERCGECGQKILVGVRQMAERERLQAADRDVRTLCMLCAALAAHALEANLDEVTRHLGGR